MARNVLIIITLLHADCSKLFGEYTHCIYGLRFPVLALHFLKPGLGLPNLSLPMYVVSLPTIIIVARLSTEELPRVTR